MSNLFPFSFTNRSQPMPNIPDDEQTLYPKPDWRGARFEKALPITGADGTTRTLNECATVVSTEKIAKLAPAKTDDGMLLFVVLILGGAVFVGGCIGYCIGVH